MAAHAAKGSTGPLLCLLSEGSSDAVSAGLRKAAAPLAGVTVIAERRETDRRARVGLREEASTLIRRPAGGTTFRTERRKAERRMDLRPAPPPPELRALVSEHPQAARFARRLRAPSSDAKAAELIRRVQGGDSDALDELYRLYLAPLYGYMVVSLRDHHAAEDAAHEVFVRVLRALPRYELRGVPFRVWLFRIARNHLLNAVARARPEGPEEPAAVTRKLESQPGEAPEAALSALSDDEFMQLIQILPLGQRQVLVLRYVFDMSFNEIAAVLDMSAAAARNQQRRAFAALRPRLLARRRGVTTGSHLAMSRLTREPTALLGRRRAAFSASRM